MNKEPHVALLGVYRGAVTQRYGLQTAIAKCPVDTPVYLSELGLEGDQCADLRHHGGLDRALHHYPREHYAFWQQQCPESGHWQAPGMGENLSTLGMTEATVCLGDRLRWGDAEIEVSQPRSPCFKLNRRWQVADFAAQMQRSGRCGWLYRVVKPGRVSISEPLVLIDRLAQAMTVAQVCQIYFGDPLQEQGLRQLLSQSALAASWREKIEQRLQTGQVEPWHFRLQGPPESG
ncbi:MOSC domain-containing protein [Neptuniibacter halophilus]|uniref:MOSC domain-containing protein n=1 Tax=Neptuniibacter halophilus TaxID=651666 RepID=UPI0025735122|nr:MOSC domain-containing protein [Neptuniibacter halophilus]